MPRLRVRIGGSARADLKRLAEYIIETSGLPQTARDYVDRIQKRCLGLGDFPIVGTDLGHIRPGLRSVPFEGTVIAFQVGASEVNVRRVFGAAQDYHRHLRGRQ